MPAGSASEERTIVSLTGRAAIRGVEKGAVVDIWRLLYPLIPERHIAPSPRCGSGVPALVKEEWRVVVR
jgi:hypothetical protein